MRRSKYAGMNPWAKSTVANAVKVENAGSLSAVWHTLKRYTMADGNVYTEYQQTVVESISDVYFTALHDQNGNKLPQSLWTDAEMKTW